VREISKIYQEAIRGLLSEIAARLEQGVKGEMVLVVEGRREETPDSSTLSSALWQEEAERLLEEGCSVKTVAREISERRGVPKNAVKDFLWGRTGTAGAEPPAEPPEDA
jgi:16S rRNA (cytidine1402-2'-O)-methyltransferase